MRDGCVASWLGPRPGFPAGSRFERRLLFLIVSVFLCACASYRAAPIEPARLEQKFEARTLSNPLLCEYLKTDLGSSFKSCPPREWDLSRLTLAALFYSPELAVASARLDVARSAIITAGQRPNPSLGFGPAYAGSDSPTFAPWAIGAAGLNIPIETAGRRQIRITRAERMADAAALSLGETAWMVRSRVRKAFFDYLLARRERGVARAQQQAASEVVKLVSQRVRQGEAPEPALTLALANQARATLKAAQAETRVPQALTRLAAAVGVPVGALKDVRFQWPGFEEPPAVSRLTPERIQRLALLNRLDLRRALVEYQAAEAALKLQVARQYPNINIGGGYGWEVGENLFELTPTVILPLLNQNQGPIAEAKARREEAGRRFAALQAQIIAQAAEALARYRGSLDVLAQANRSAALEGRRLEAVRIALEAGETDRLSFEITKLAALSARESALGALGQSQAALGLLEDAVQRPLGPEHLRTFALPPMARRASPGGRA
jgi:cobalt-zinc-cadmium efflux system outer membrane protein